MKGRFYANKSSKPDAPSTMFQTSVTLSTLPSGSVNQAYRQLSTINGLQTLQGALPGQQLRLYFLAA